MSITAAPGIRAASGRCWQLASRSKRRACGCVAAAALAVALRDMQALGSLLGGFNCMRCRIHGTCRSCCPVACMQPPHHQHSTPPHCACAGTCPSGLAPARCMWRCGAQRSATSTWSHGERRAAACAFSLHASGHGSLAAGSTCRQPHSRSSCRSPRRLLLPCSLLLAACLSALAASFDRAKGRAEPRWETVWSRVTLHQAWERELAAEEPAMQLYASWRYNR